MLAAVGHIVFQLSTLYIHYNVGLKLDGLLFNCYKKALQVQATAAFSYYLHLDITLLFDANVYNSLDSNDFIPDANSTLEFTLNV